MRDIGVCCHNTYRVVRSRHFLACLFVDLERDSQSNRFIVCLHLTLVTLLEQPVDNWIATLPRWTSENNLVSRPRGYLDSYLHPPRTACNEPVNSL